MQINKHGWTVATLRECPICQARGRIDIPVWRADVEGWSYETVVCPICLGKCWLDAQAWAMILERLKS